MKKILALALAVVMFVSLLPMTAYASEFDTSATGNYFTVISENRYALAPGATETELVLNNADGSDRKVVHYFEVDTKNENIEVLPGYYGIDKLDPDNLALDGIADKTQYWKAEQLTKTVAYYEGLGYNVVGAMNTALAYDSDAPYGYMVWDGVVLGTPEVHPGSKTYLAIDADGNCELRSMSTPLNGSEVTAISANFDWLVKDGELYSYKVEERTSSDASRSMIGIKADGTLIFCQVDGRNAPFSTGLSNYEMGEMMLALGCVNAVNCDGGGSSTFVSKREGEASNTMRSVPSDGSERATINSVILVSKAKATGEFDHAVLTTDYDYYAPGTSATMNVQGVDAAGSPAELPTEGITWALSDSSFGTASDGVFTSNGKKGDVTVQMLYNGEIVGEKSIHVVDPEVFALLLDETVLPYGKSMTIDFACTYGVDDWAVCVDGAYTLALSDAAAATLDGNVLVGTSDESIVGVDVTATYIPDSAVTDILKVTYGKGSEIIFDFEDGDTAGFMGFDEAKQWSIDNGIANTLVGSKPLAGQFSGNVDGDTFVSTNIVRNGKYALAWNVDNTDSDFAGWTYNVLFNIGESVVLRDVANGKNATALGMWLYIPEGAAGLAFQSQLYAKNADGSYSCKQDHFMFTTVSGIRKNLNSCTEADIPESRWVYASIDLTPYDYLCMPVATDEGNSRSPSFIRTYVKPMTPAVHTFYIDDITLDYSSAVDDRVLPTITDVSYATQDESVALNEGATINGNSISFSAIIADNNKLDYSTGKIYVDGNALVNVSASGKHLATTANVTLTSGVHTVAFEIKDILGNPMKVTRTFTVAGYSAITLSGHNDSGAKPEYGSVYYADITVADISNVNKLSVDLLLQDANTWEPQGITVAEGFTASYSLDAVENILSLNIERNGETVDETATTVVSAPVRLWTWDAIDHVTGEEITPETQYKTGYCPVVTVDCEVLQGIVNDTDSFGGRISVETMINDIVNPWHYHDAVLSTLNQDATCVLDGYSNRTYCETCKSVIDWGTVIEAEGHNYVDGKCACGATNTFTGLKEEDGNWYYYINGVAASGWQMIGTDWYYFDTETKIGAEGDTKIGAITYNFKNGKMTSGVWVKTLFGTRYYNGPNPHKFGWLTIDGKDYCFENYCRVEGGYQSIFENNINPLWYYFEEDGSCDKTKKIPDGFYTDRNGYSYVKDGVALTGFQTIEGATYYFDRYGYAVKGYYANHIFGDDYKAVTGIIDNIYHRNGKPYMGGLVEVDGDLYFATGNGELVTGSYYVWKGNGILPEDTYEFGADGKLVNGTVEKDGQVYCYNMGKAILGLNEIDGEYYFVKSADGLCATGTYYVWQGNGILPEGVYVFGTDGKMLDGIVEKDGNYYYYEAGKPKMAGLVEVDGAYYFAKNADGLCVTGKYYVWKGNGILRDDTYEFGTDGKMLDGIVEKDGNYYYYETGKSKMAGLVEVDGAYYFAKNADGLCVTGKYYVWKGNGILPEDTYEFGADGKMLGGIVEKDGNYYYYETGKSKMAGLVEVDGAYYFAKNADGLCVTGKYYVWKGNGILRDDTYEFGTDGKMLDGIVEKDGNYYYYETGKSKMAGLVEVDGAYYFVKDADGLCVTDCKYYVWLGNGILPEGTYEFGADGKILDGFVTKDDGIYYYENGRFGTVGINYIDGHYYFVKHDGKLVVDCKYYVWATNGYTMESEYVFDKVGRVVR